MLWMSFPHMQNFTLILLGFSPHICEIVHPLLWLFIALCLHLQPRSRHGFWHALCQKMYVHTKCGFWVRKTKFYIYTPFYPENHHFLTGLSKFLSDNDLTMGMLESRLSLIIISLIKVVYRIGKSGLGIPNM